MPIKNDDYGKVRLVVFRPTWRQLCSMAGVDESRQQVYVEVDGEAEPRNVQAIHPVAHHSEQVFWVCATILLGNADAMMLASIYRNEDGLIWFDGLEVA